MSASYLATPIDILYWVALKSKYVCMMDWAEDLRKTERNSGQLEYPLKEAVELVEKYWTGESGGSIFR